MALFSALGVWQVQRRAWKLDLIARVESRIHAAPRPLPATIDPGADEYRRVRVEGRWLPGRDTLVQALTERGAGFWVLSALSTDRGVVLVNRGFVPGGWRQTAPVEGLVAVTGLLRVSEPGGGFLRRNDPAGDRWYSRDVAAIARARHLDRIQPFFIDADATPNPGGLPIGGLTVVTFRNTHLVYAITWFGLACLSLAGLVLLARRQ